MNYVNQHARSAYKVPADVGSGAVAKWRRSRLIDRRSLLTPLPCKAKTRYQIALEPMCAVGMVTGMITPPEIPRYLYIMAAPVTIIPLVLFAVELNNTSIIVTGPAQYIEPSLQFIIAILIFKVVIHYPESAAWFGLLLCIFKRLYHHYGRNVPGSESKHPAGTLW